MRSLFEKGKVIHGVDILIEIEYLNKKNSQEHWFNGGPVEAH